MARTARGHRSSGDTARMVRVDSRLRIGEASTRETIRSRRRAADSSVSYGLSVCQRRSDARDWTAGRRSMPNTKDLIAKVITGMHEAAYRMTGGWLGSRVAGMPVLLL